MPAPAPPPAADAAPSARCAAADLASFPWPDPSQPSVTATVAPYLLFERDAGEDMDDLLDVLLAKHTGRGARWRGWRRGLRCCSASAWRTATSAPTATT